MHKLINVFICMWFLSFGVGTLFDLLLMTEVHHGINAILATGVASLLTFLENKLHLT